MVTAGIDAGALTTKVVLLKAGRVISRAVLPTGVDVAMAARKGIEIALKDARIAFEEIKSIMCTGAGKKKISFKAEQLTEIMCDASGARYLYPDANGVIDIGAESCRAIKFDRRGNVVDFAMNDKCASGTGIFLNAMAKALRVKPEDMGELSLQSTRDVEVTSMCSVFAESEVVSMIHGKVPRNDILKGIHKSIASRICGLANRTKLEGKVIIIGGIAGNIGLVTVLRELMDCELSVPEEPELVGAIGAALLAKKGV